MRFPSQERFLQYCISKRRTYLRLLFERRNARGFFELWKGELDFARSRFEVDGMPRERVAGLGRELRWLLLQDLHQVVRSVVPDFPPVPPTVVAALPGAMHQVRVARSMLIAGEQGVGKEQLAILLHVLAGRPGAMVRVAAGELGASGGAQARRLMPERGSVFIADLEDVDPIAQEELLGFLNGDARRRDLLFFVATRAEPRDLVSRHGIRRDLFVRVSQTEVRLPALDAQPDGVAQYVSDVLFDLVRVPTERLSELRSEARKLGESWQGPTPSAPASPYDFFAEALSYVMWREKARLAGAALAAPWCAHLLEGSTGDSADELRDRIAAAFDRNAFSDALSTEQETDGFRIAPLPREAPARRPAEVESRPIEPGVLVPTALSRDQLLRLYYQSLLAEERGDLRRVAARAGRRLRSLHAELARLGVRIPRELAHSSPTGEA